MAHEKPDQNIIHTDFFRDTPVSVAQGVTERGQLVARRVVTRTGKGISRARAAKAASTIWYQGLWTRA
jgi:hypothetical protein